MSASETVPTALLADTSAAALAALLDQGYAAYTYAYPHKSAYRTLPHTVSLAELWQAELRDDLFLYLHIPFCHYRCGFCNLFALGAPKPEWVDGYLEALKRQIVSSASALGVHRITRFAIGGGTPSYLSAAQFETLMDFLQRQFNLTAGGGFAIEVAPDSVNDERLRSYKRAGVTRISMGVQSFIDREMDALARPRQREAVLAAVEAIRAHEIPRLNLDLIYGIEGQTERSFLSSLECVVALQPDEIYLYPLYVRRLTGLAKARRTHGLEQRAMLYRLGVERLRAAGFVQSSMRMFKRSAATFESAFDCQNIGTVGLGAGARSYTRGLHYSEEYAVSRNATQEVLRAFNARSETEFASARYGFVLNLDEQCRRYLLQSLLMWPGVSFADYQHRFGRTLDGDFPQLRHLLQLGFAERKSTHIALSEAGMAQADVIGPWLYSDDVRRRMDDYDWH
jgi:oxygen-independent coproporphyrinogen-3 oxidase